MKYFKSILKKFVTTLFVGVCYAVSFGAPSPPSGGGPGSCFPNPCLPIDQGIDFLTIGGVLIAAYFLYKIAPLKSNSQRK